MQKSNENKEDNKQTTKDIDLNAIVDLTETFAKDLNVWTYSKVFQNKTKITDYKILNNLAKGGFGEVFVGEKDGKIYAIKRASKDMIKKNRNSTFCMLEREIMTQSKSQWLVLAHETLQDDVYLYYVMDFIIGGDLLGYLSKSDIISEKEVKFYSAEIVMALDTLHKLGFVHRDLKPDNIFIDKTGHIKLGDFGSAARLDENGNASSTVPIGTPDYVCRDVLLNNDSGESIYNATVDFWTLGAIIYEMVIGEPPFYAEQLKETYKKILSLDYAKLEQGSPELKDLLDKLICPGEQRLNAEGIKAHPFFADIDWENLHNMTPPMVPQISHDKDISMFVDSNFRPETSTIKGGYTDFVGFTYDPKYVSTFGEIFARDILKTNSTISGAVSAPVVIENPIPKTAEIDEAALTGVLAEIKKQIDESEEILEKKRDDMDQLLKSKMKEIDEYNLKIEELTSEKEERVSEATRSRTELKGIVDDLLCKKEELRNVMEEMGNKRVEYENIQADLKKKMVLLDKSDHADLIKDTVDDLKLSIDRANYKSTIKELKSTLYWFYKEHEVMKKELALNKVEITENSMEELKKQLRSYKTEIKDYQQRIETEITARNMIENENKKLQKMLKENRSNEVANITFATKEAITNKQMDFVYEDGCFVLDGHKYDPMSIYAREIKNGEYHHFEYKKRSLCVVVHFLKDYTLTSCSIAKRSAKAVESDLENEINVLEGLNELELILTGPALKEMQAQKQGSLKKIDSLKHELSMAKSASTTEFNYGDDDNVVEFNNHLFREHTVGKGTLCDHCNEVIYGVVNQAYQCNDCLCTVHKSCYVLVETSCELQRAINKGKCVPVILRNIEEKEKFIKMTKI